MADKHCITCTCGLTHVEWSDREGWVDTSNPRAVMSIVINCALDHYYDRTHSGIPYGIPEVIEKLLAPIVEKHLSAIEPTWQVKTVYMDNGQRVAFEEELLKVLEEYNGNS